jgi:hypothetical protein
MNAERGEDEIETVGDDREEQKDAHRKPSEKAARPVHLPRGRHLIQRAA